MWQRPPRRDVTVRYLRSYTTLPARRTCAISDAGVSRQCATPWLQCRNQFVSDIRSSRFVSHGQASIVSIHRGNGKELAEIQIERLFGARERQLPLFSAEAQLLPRPPTWRRVSCRMQAGSASR